ncbi:MAG: hypothetical protein HYT47_02245 [Candidatus Vogelbacteria bacterium]|nr:hypothetical protein [Candidatus Vogelbacteria bacterium]
MDNYRWGDNVVYIVVVVFVGILLWQFIPVEQTEIPSASVWSPMGQTPAQVDQDITSNLARERAKKLAGAPPRYWHVQAIFYRTDTDSVWVYLVEISPQPATAGLVVHSSHPFYKDWTGLPANVSITLSATELLDKTRPEAPESYLTISCLTIGGRT